VHACSYGGRDLGFRSEREARRGGVMRPRANDSTNTGDTTPTSHEPGSTRAAAREPKKVERRHGGEEMRSELAYLPERQCVAKRRPEIARWKRHHLLRRR
jgi:hypothetical protein